jgi:hypothetical protein
MKVGIRVWVLIMATACASPPGAVPVKTSFSGDSIREGQAFRRLTVGRVDLRRTAYPEFPYAGNVSFRGELTVTGEYRPHFDYPEVKEPCFWVDAADSEKLPRIDFDTRKPWFCFSNSSDAIRLLGAVGDTIHATIVVDDYVTYIAQSDVWDVARLVRVVSR